MSQSRNSLVLAACLIAPAASALLRKIVPGQPSSLEIMGVLVVLAGGVWVLRQPLRPPAWLLTPLLVWAYFQLFYAVLAVRDDWRIGVVASLVRIAPMLMAPIAFAAVRSVEDLRNASKPAAVLALLLVPVGLAVAFFGNNSLPTVLQPIQELLEMGRGNRAGVPGVAAIFSTFAVLSLSMLAVFYLCLANIAVAEEQGRKTTGWWLFAISALVMVYLSTRRGAFIAAMIGLAVYAVYRRRIPLRLLVPGVVAVLIFFAIEAYGTFTTSWSQGRAELLLRAFDTRAIAVRVFGILMPLLWMWLRLTPMGTYLGFAGPEGTAFGPPVEARFTTDLVEVGGAQLLAETGIAGLLLMPIVVTMVMARLLRHSRGLFSRRAIILLVTFQATFFALYYLKELTAMTSVSMAQLFFWASSGIGAALIDRENRERRYWRAAVESYLEQEEAAVEGG